MRSQPRVLPSVNTGATELRSDDGSTFLRLDPASQKVKIVAPGGFEVVAPVSEFSDQVLVKGLLSYVAGLVGSGGQGSAARITGALNVIGQIIANGKRVDDTHTHTAQAPTRPPRRPTETPMRYRKLDADGDYSFGARQADFSGTLRTPSRRPSRRG